MEHALRALRQLSAGLGNEASVLKAASLVPAEGWQMAEADAASAAVRQFSDSEEEEETDARGQVMKLSELYTWGRASNYQLGYGVSGNEQQIPKLVQLPIGKQVVRQPQSVHTRSCKWLKLILQSNLMLWRDHERLERSQISRKMLCHKRKCAEVLILWALSQHCCYFLWTCLHLGFCRCQQSIGPWAIQTGSSRSRSGGTYSIATIRTGKAPCYKGCHRTESHTGNDSCWEALGLGLQWKRSTRTWDSWRDRIGSANSFEGRKISLNASSALAAGCQTPKWNVGSDLNHHSALQIVWLMYIMFWSIASSRYVQATPWQKQKVTDIAAGAMHSLCIAGLCWQATSFWVVACTMEFFNEILQVIDTVQSWIDCGLSMFITFPQIKCPDSRLPDHNAHTLWWRRVTQVNPGKYLHGAAMLMVLWASELHQLDLLMLHSHSVCLISNRQPS